MIDGAATVQLPIHFTARRVAVIVLLVEIVENEPTRLQELLLTAPVVSVDELQGFGRNTLPPYDRMSGWY